MNELFGLILIAVIGLAGGLAVGSGFVAFITVLDIIPRLAQIIGTQRTQSFEFAVVIGVLFFTVIDFFDVTFRLSPIGMIFIGLICGVFVGMLAAALTEVLNVFPILAKRLRLGRFMVWLLMAMVLGKIVGSLFDWIVYQRLE